MKIPRSRARTAFGLLSDIKKAIHVEPLRMRMSVVCFIPGLTATYLRDVSYGEDLNDSNAFKKPLPECGAVGCVAGWSLLMSGRITKTQNGTWLGSQTGQARALLGLSTVQGRELFFPQDLMTDPDQGSEAYAARVIDHITMFQMKYEKQLKATKIPASPSSETNATASA